jgi:hypothetical protein
VYSTTSIGHHTQTVDIDETCETPPPGRISCYTPEARIDHLLAFDNIAFAQGSGWFGAALLDDHAGSDQYLTAVENYIDAHVRDRRTVASEPATMAVLSSNGQPTMGAQGSLDSNGHGQDVDTFAALIDHDGTDSYTARHIKAINADGSSVNGRQPQVRAESVYQIRIGAQGATFLPAGRPDAVGALLDLGGANDRFRAISDIPAVTAPDPSGAVELRAFRPSFQAGGAKGYPPVVESGAAGQAVFVADGANPSVVASPSQVTCTGTVRGYGTWRECRGTDAEGSFASPNSGPLDLYGASYGRAPSATGRATALAFVDPTTTRAGRSEAPRGLPFTVRLLDDAGQPLRGATVHVELDRASANAPWTGLVPQLSNSWNTGTGVDAVTDQDGIAMGQVPLPIIQPWVPNNPVYLEPEYRIFATYDGDTGLRPDFAAVSFRLD